MSAWKIIIENGNDLRWECSELKTDCTADRIHFHSPSTSSRLPSMTDLLVQGCSKIMENRDEGVQRFPAFRTGLGRSVAVKQSSISKALSLLSEPANAAVDEGSGKVVNISSKGLFRAKALLGLKKDNVHNDFNKLKDRRKYQDTENYGWHKSNDLENNSVDILKNDSNVSLLQPEIGDTTIGDPPIFQTAGGRSISVSNDALKRARSLLGDPELGAFLNPGIKNVGLSSYTNNQGSELTLCNGGSEPNFLKNDSNLSKLQPKIGDTTFKDPPIMFQTAGESSIYVSNDALKRARSLLGDPDLGPLLNEGVQNGVRSSYTNNEGSKLNLSNGGSEPSPPFSYPQMTNSNQKIKGFTSPLYPSSNPLLLPSKPVSMDKGTNLMKKFNAVGSENGSRVMNGISHQQNETDQYNSFPEEIADSSLSNGTVSRINSLGISCGWPLVDISNTVSAAKANNRQAASQKRQLGKATSISPFKRPRISMFRTPFKHDTAVFHNGLSSSTAENSTCKKTIFSQYPFRVPRKYMREFFTNTPVEHKMLSYVSDEVRWICPDNAEEYIFSNGSGLNGIGAEAFFHMLLQCGASARFTSKEWVRNHYKWIVWKLACYERCYRSTPCCFVTVSNVLQELKYRYEREVNHGHRSAIKKILEGDASSSWMMILCVSAIHLNKECNIVSLSGGGNDPVKIELTDGWYSTAAVLDDPLSKQLLTRRLFVGQKLRIWGAGLCSWAGPVSPLEASTAVSLVLHMNGTYRAHWAERLGFCKYVGPPLALRCIKCNGGLVPQTIAGITRIYPLLYRERLANGDFMVRPERMENHAMYLHNQRRFSIVEDIICEFQMDTKASRVCNDSQSEGAKIFKILETAADPDVLMADMSVEQLNTFASYQAKLQAVRKARMEKSIEDALNDAGLHDREVTPFMRVRVVGLTGKCCQGEDRLKEGIITIWNPTEKQLSELVEGQAYVISGLRPSGLDSDTLQLQTRGSSSKWQPLSHKAMEQFKPFYNCGESTSLSSLGDIPLSREFDVAALVVHVGGVYVAANQKKQWVFVTDGSISETESDELINSLLAISFSIPLTDDDSFAPFNSNLAGSTVGFCNLIKRAKDCSNHVWVADATDNSTFSLTFDSPHYSHLRKAAKLTNDWANISNSIIDKIREKVLFIIGG